MFKRSLLLIGSLIAINLHSMQELCNSSHACSFLKDIEIALYKGDIEELKALTNFAKFYNKDHEVDLDAYLKELEHHKLPNYILYEIAASEGSNYKVRFCNQSMRMLNMLILTLNAETFKYVQEFVLRCPLNDLNLPASKDTLFTPLHQALYYMNTFLEKADNDISRYYIFKQIVETLLRKGADPTIEDAYNIKVYKINAFKWHKVDFERCIREYQEKSFVSWRASHYFGEDEPRENIMKQQHKKYEHNKKLAEFYKLQAIAKKHHEVIDLTIMSVND